MKINETLRKLDKKIIIIIDDLDRLDKSEIIEVIRLIRNTANFYNTCFIVAYDKGYVTNAIGDMNDYQKEYYLEKIFQLEVVLPQVKSGIVTDYLLNELNNVYDNYNVYRAFEADIGELIIEECIKNIRDTNRFINSFTLNYALIKQDVLLSEFILLELIRYKYPQIIPYIFNNKNLFFSKTENDFLTLKRLDQDKKDEEYQVTKYRLEVNLKEQKEYLSIDDEVIELTIGLFESLFTGYSAQMLNPKIEKSIQLSKNFYRYFSLKILSNQIPSFEFNDLLYDNNYNNIIENIDDWIKGGFQEDLFRKFYLFKATTKESYKNHLKAYFHLINKTKNINDFEKLAERIIFKINNKHFKPSNITDNELYLIVDDILKNACEPYYAERKFIYYMNRQWYANNFKFPISKKERIILVSTYFLNYIKSHQNNYDFIVFWSLFRATEFSTFHTDKHNNIHEKTEIPMNVINALKEFVYNKTSEFLDLIILEHPMNDGYFTIFLGIEKIYSVDINGFIKILNQTLKPSKKLDELNSFHSKLEINSNSNDDKYAKFSFKYLKTNRYKSSIDLSKR